MWVQVPLSLFISGDSESISIGRLSALGVGGYGFKSHFSDMVESILIVPLIGILALLITPRDDIMCL